MRVAPYVKRLICVGLLGMALPIACARPTPYQHISAGGGGYSETRVERNRFFVSFIGNALTDQQTVEEFVLLRAAEITIDEGFSHFRVLRLETDPRFQVPGHFRPDERPDPAYRYHHPEYGLYGWSDPVWDQLQHAPRRSYQVRAEIMLYLAPPADDPEYRSARETLQRFSRR